MTYTLEEHAESDVVPAEVEVKTELVAWSNVTDTLEVAMILECTVTYANFAVTVYVDELKVTGICLEIVTVLMVGVFCPVVCLCVRKEVSVSAESQISPSSLPV